MGQAALYKAISRSLLMIELEVELENIFKEKKNSLGEGEREIERRE